ncbi:type II secretion system protein F, partial [Micrococcus sp. SIMBA_131]
ATPAGVRARQVLSAAAGAAVAAVLALGLTVAGRVPVITGVARVIAGGMAGFLLRELLLSPRVRRRREAILSEFPPVA